MRTTMDRAGRVVVPKELRRALHLLDGGEIDIIERDGAVEIRPAVAHVEIVETPEGPVAHMVDSHGTQSGRALNDAVIRDTLDQVRR